MKIEYTRKELASFAANALKSFLTGFLRILWSVILLVANIALWVERKAVSAIRLYPCVAVGLVFVVMAVFSVAMYADMKAKLTTAEWQRDGMALKLDSIETYNGTKPSYYRFENYNVK